MIRVFPLRTVVGDVIVTTTRRDATLYETTIGGDGFGDVVQEHNATCVDAVISHLAAVEFCRDAEAL